MTGIQERAPRDLANLGENEIVVLGENGGQYLFSRNSRGTVRLNRGRSVGVIRSEITTVRTTAMELLDTRDALAAE